MKVASFRFRVDWGHLVFVLAVAAFCVWYWVDARAASTSTQNLLLIQPAVVLALILCAAIAVRLVRIERVNRAEEMREKRAPAAPLIQALARSGELPGALFAVLLGAYVFGILLAGFDVATFLFVAAGMYLLGERRLLFLSAFAALFALALSYGFKMMLSVPVPTLIL